MWVFCLHVKSVSWGAWCPWRPEGIRHLLSQLERSRNLRYKSGLCADLLTLTMEIKAFARKCRSRLIEVSAQSFHTNEMAEGESKLTINGKHWIPKSDKFGNLANASNCKAEKWAVSSKRVGGEQKRIKGREPVFQKTRHRRSWSNKQ